MKKLLIIIFCMVVIFSFTGCGSSMQQDMTVSESSAYNDNSGSSDYDHFDAENIFSEEELLNDMNQRKIIKNAELTVEVEYLEDTVGYIEEQVTGNNGYLAESNIYNHNADRLWSNMVIRIPTERFEIFMSDLEEIGIVKNRRIYLDDVTTQFIDLEARLKVLKAEEESVLGILDNAAAVEDVLNIRKELRIIRSEIEVLEGELKYLSNMVNFSTIRLNLEQVKNSESRIDATGFSGVWQRSIASLTKNTNMVISLTGNFIVLVIGSIPVLILIGGVVAVIWYLKKKKYKGKNE